MPSFATSRASERANPATAGRSAFESSRLPTGRSAVIDVTQRMRPQPPLRMWAPADVERRLERLRPVWQVRRDVQDLAGRDVDDLRLVLAEPEAQPALEDVRQLLVFVLVARDDAPLLEVDVRQHHPLGRDQPPAEL